MILYIAMTTVYPKFQRASGVEPNARADDEIASSVMPWHLKYYHSAKNIMDSTSQFKKAIWLGSIDALKITKYTVIINICCKEITCSGLRKYSLMPKSDHQAIMSLTKHWVNYVFN